MMRLRLIKETSINSISEIYKEKEMADFRKLFYAFALVALLAGLSVSASAQSTQPFVCNTNAATPPIIRAEGYTELVGDLILNCTGGSPTPVGQLVPQVNVTILLNTNITSRLLGSGGLFNEALLIVDEPHSAVSNVTAVRQLLNCGAAGAPDTNPVTGPGVCEIVSTGNPSATYDGTPSQVVTTGGVVQTCGASGAPAANAYGCGRPNVFQGRPGAAVNNAAGNTTVFAGVPLDPPGTTTNRTIRITNVRANATQVATAGSTFTTAVIQMNIAINGTTSVSINNPQQFVAYVQRGLVTTVVNPQLSYLQCQPENSATGTGPFGNLYGTITNGTAPGNANTVIPPAPVGGQAGGRPQQAVRFSEGFLSSFKTKNFSFEANDAAAGRTGNGFLPSTSNAYWTYNGASGGPGATFRYPTDMNQNVPGAIYNTESGFENLGASNEPTAPGILTPPQGTGPNTSPTPATLISQQALPFSNANGNNTGIANAGVANQGTRLAMSFSSLPNGTAIWVPTYVFLYRQGAFANSATGNAQALSESVAGGVPTGAAGNFVTGVAVLVTGSVDANGANGATATVSGVSNPLVPVGANNLAVYEVLFADPFTLEATDVPVVLAYPTNLTQNLPQPGVTTQVAGGFAPFYSTAAAGLASATLPIPRFTPGNTPAPLLAIVKCACNILFAYVVSAAGFDSGIAIANTSVDPGLTFGFGAGGAATQAQNGTVQFWYYGTTASGGAAPGTQCTNTASPGTCPGTTNVPAGQVLTYVLSSGSSQWGLDNRGAGFIGYVIAQSQFQYCHAFAYITAIGQGALVPGAGIASEGYLGLIMDQGGLIRTPITSESLNN